MEFVNLKMEDYPSFLKLYNDSFPDNERRIYEDEEHLANFIKMKGANSTLSPPRTATFSSRFFLTGLSSDIPTWSISPCSLNTEGKESAH